MLEYDLDECHSEWVHESNTPDLSHLKDHLQGVADAFYKTGDTQSLENCLDECFHALDMKLIPCDKPAMKSSKNPDLMQWYLGYQRSQIDFMNNNNLTAADYKNYNSEMKDA